MLISGGSGITPVLSMLRTLVDEGYAGKVCFLHYADKAADVPYRAELAAIAADNDNVDVVLAYTAESAGADLVGAAEDVGVIEVDLTHPLESGQHPGAFGPEHGAELGCGHEVIWAARLP